jgi:hypothetical protein
LLLTPQEASAVACLRKDGGVQGQGTEVNEPSIHEGPKSAYIGEIHKKRKERAEERYGEYHKADFILGSAAEIERVWSSAEKILTPARFSIHPIQLEAILFLKYNKKYWNKSTIVQAIKLLKEEDSNERYKKEMGRFGVLDNDYD